jgi:uncharacterized protein
METMPMTEEAVTILSAGLKLSGVVHVPRGLRPSERRGAFLVLHGFGSNKTSSNTMQPTKVLSELGYVVLRFDMRGCGDSEGEFGRVICLEQVEDTRSALTFLARHPAVDPERIGLIGSSFGGAVAVYTGGVDARVAAVISNGGWGDGERKFRGQHKSPQEWARFTNMLKEGREHRARTGKSLMVPRYDIVPIPPHLRSNLASNSIQSFPAETAQSMFDFRADDVVARIAPRPLLLLHAANDSVTPTEQSIELFKRGQYSRLGAAARLARRLFSGDGGGEKSGGGNAPVSAAPERVPTMRRNGLGRWARTCSMTALCAFVGWGTSVAADDYPSRPLRLVLGFTAGGPTDIPARFLADRLSASLGKPVMVENKPGAGALLAAMDVLSRPRDGHDLLLCTYFDAVNTLLYRNAKYKLSDIVGISLIAKYSYAVAVSHSVPAQSFNELIEYTKAHPERINYGHLGAGSTQNLLAKKLEKATGMKMTPFPTRAPRKHCRRSSPGERTS